MMRQIGKISLTLSALLLAVLAGWPAAADEQGLATPLDGIARGIVVNPLTGVAIDGMDAVSYFTEDEPRPGSPDHELVWHGVPWFFVSEANRAVFAEAPEIYAPQFGGFGLTALSRGFLSDGNPHIYEVFSNRLYLFYSTGNRQAFEQARLAVIEAAGGQWQRVGPEAGASVAEAQR